MGRIIATGIVVVSADFVTVVEPQPKTSTTQFLFEVKKYSLADFMLNVGASPGKVKQCLLRIKD